MLESLNDYISLGVMIFLVIAALRLLMAAIYFRSGDERKKSNGVIFGYSDNEDE